MKKYVYILLTLALVACTEDDLKVPTAPNATQLSLIGKAVNFNATIVDEFKQESRTTYDDSGKFNEYDIMRIYREYENESGSGWDNTHLAYRTYFFDTKYATGTSISLSKDWKVETRRKGLGKGDDYTTVFEQTAADSLTWESGLAVRFRSWTRSNYANCLLGCYKNEGANGLTNYYPDFCLSDWVTISGPTEQIPLSMRHVCSRIAIAYLNNANQFHRVEVATDWEDYKRADNSDSNENDDSAAEAGKTDAVAQAECNLVTTAYNRMCMPAGVDVESSEMYAMTQSYWSALKNVTADNNKLRYLEDESRTNFVNFGAKTSEEIVSVVQRPIFANVNQSCYLLTIPYDMSNGPTKGDIITLPACTRFKVYMRDVNNGDGNNTSGFEGTYHIFSLQDIKNPDGTAKYPDGLVMLPGHSYKFYVGYRYGALTITASDHLSWEEQDLEPLPTEEDYTVIPETSPAAYTWWKNTIKNAIPTTSGGDFEPKFHITNEQEFIEFINLVNGTAATNTDESLKRAKRSVINEDHKNNEYDKYYWWYTGVSDNKRDTTWVNSEEATALGYLLYESYHAANANQPAFSQEEYVRGPYPFYDQTRDRHYTVYLDADLDLKDWLLTSIGDAENTPFMGFFDGQMHTLSNIYMKDEYLFKYLNAAAVRNLKITSTHKVSLAKEGKNTCYLVGIDLHAHSSVNSLIERLTTNQYNNPSYVVGCIHVGDATGALVGAAGNMYMFGCMQAAEGIPSGQGALVGSYLPYSSESNWRFLEPRVSFDYYDMSKKLNGKPTWGRFMCNYYDTELSPGTNAVSTISDLYSPLEYIRGRESYILKAKNDNMVKGDLSFNSLTTVNQRLAYYGLAPWKAMNYGIRQYNATAAGNTHPCRAHYENNSTGYVHRYPELKTGVPTAEQWANTLEQKN